MSVNDSIFQDRLCFDSNLPSTVLDNNMNVPYNTNHVNTTNSNHSLNICVNNILNFSVFHQNIRSLRENFDTFITNLYIFDDLPSLIFLSEVWIYDYELNYYNIPNYDIFGCCNGNYRAGGVCVFYDNRLNCICESVPLNSADIIKLTVNLNNVNYLFVCVYRLQFVPISNFVSEFSEFIGKIKNKNVIILGDLNINILNFPPPCDDYIFLMSLNGFMSLINEPTRVTNQTSTCIDHCFSRVNNCKISSSLHDLHITDHKLMCVTLEINCDKLKHNTTAYYKLNYLEFSSKISSVDFSGLFSESDSNIILSQFLSMFNLLYESCLIKVVPKNSKLKLKPWISDSLINLMAVKKRINKKCRKHPDNIRLQKYYIKLCKKVCAKVTSDKYKFYGNKFSHCVKDSKKMWSMVNQILGDTTNKSVAMIMSNDSVVLTDCVSIANDFGTYFSEIVADLRKTKISSTMSYQNLNYINIPESFFINPVDATEIAGIIDELKSSNSIDILGMSANMFKRNKLTLAPILVHFVNRSFVTGCVPDSLKTAVVIPLFKKGDKLSKDNYRPICLQPTILKIMEKALKLRINSFLNKFNVISDGQYGFRHGKNTESALIEFLNGVHSNLNRKKFAGAVFIDIKKAFDMVDHSLLLHKLFLLGFRGVPYKWFVSYLSNRFFKVKIDNTYSLPFKVEFGVPQGSVLGPILFLIYINSIFNLNLKGKIIAFADDMALNYYAPSASELSNMINSDMKVLRSWFDSHYMILSEKTKIMCFRLAGDPYLSYVPNIFYHSPNCNSLICNSLCLKIEPVYTFKYLGLHLDVNLNWKVHYQTLKKQINSTLRAMYLLRPFCPSSGLLSFYYACVESKLSYGLPCWGGVYFDTLEPLYVLQKYIIRVMFFKTRSEHSWPIFAANNILPLQHLYIFKVLKLFYSRSGHRLLRMITTYDIRNNHKNLFSVPSFSSEIFRKYYIVSAPTFFNRLPLHLRLQLNCRHFLKLIKNWLFENKDVGFMFTK